MGGEGSGRKPDPVKAIVNQLTQKETVLAQPKPSEGFIFPNVSATGRNPFVIRDLDDRYSGAITEEADPFFFSLSGSFALNPPYQQTSGALITLSGQLFSLSGAHAQLSGAYYTHQNLSTNPHGSTLTQTTLLGTTISGSNITSSSKLSGASVYATTLSGQHIFSSSISGSNMIIGNSISGARMYISADQSTADTPYVANVLYNTDATPPTASTVPIGTIYIQYTA